MCTVIVIGRKNGLLNEKRTQTEFHLPWQSFRFLPHHISLKVQDALKLVTKRACYRFGATPADSGIKNDTSAPYEILPIIFIAARMPSDPLDMMPPE